ncbi:VOC family protein [Roseateles violae]|uniref:VOC family protein n=1 Tax=Roseateles violae TaxID=3058042 RepID=A0ABT8DXZ0_9BURK|nr:VOC family protein [Pelomonas sp. PFR6]MDN3922588.1 VOC family protein [Pelomonas sp. PFR6]
MKPTPKGWPRLSSSLFYENAAEAIAWLVKAFGFELQLKVDGEDGSVVHSQLVYGEALIMVGEGGGARAPKFGVKMRSPRQLGGANSQSLMLFVDDVDAHCERARAAGATIISEPSLHDYGPEYWADRSYGALDCDGHMWWFTERVRNPQS